MGSAGQFKATLKGPDGKEISGYIKGRVLPGLPLVQNFQTFAMTNIATNTVESPTPFAYPPLPWNSARFRFEVRGKDAAGGTNQALVKTIDNKLFQRGQVFFGFPDMKNYTVEAEVLSEGNKRKMSEVGLINQRYAVILKGNSQQIEVNSNQERIKVAVPFKWARRPGTASRPASTWPPTAPASCAARRGRRATRSPKPGPSRCRTRRPMPSRISGSRTASRRRRCAWPSTTSG
jgi:hypothetical protein